MGNKDMIIAVGGGVVGVVCLAALSIAKKAMRNSQTAQENLDRLYNKLNMTLTDIENKTTVEISDSLIDSVVAAMAERKLDRVIPGKVEDAVNSIKAEAVAKIKTDISRKTEAMAPEIESRLKVQLDCVSIDDTKKEVIERAVTAAKREALDDISKTKDSVIRDIEDCRKRMEDEIEDKVDDIVDDLEDKAEDKFNEELDTLTTRYKSRLDDVSSIYASLANKIGN